MNRHHVSPIQVAVVNDDAESSADFEWVTPDARMLGAWANAIDTTEAGAYGCVIACVEEYRGLFAVRRAETGSGADYYVGPAGAGGEDLEDCLRLEVSGVDRGDRREVERRLLQKTQQLRDGQGSLPALAGVMGFSAKVLMVRSVGDSP